MNTEVNDGSIFDWLTGPAARPDSRAQEIAQNRQADLTKPPGALGMLEDVAIRLAALQGTPSPHIERVHITVFAGDHGVAAEGVSAFPQAVTAEMVKSFAQGSAAICVAARTVGAELEVINLGTVSDTGPLKGVKNYALGHGTANFMREPAMDCRQLEGALSAGRDAAQRAHLQNAQIFIGGEMGIGNTSAATAIACALLDTPPEQLTGPGTGLDKQGVAHKIRVIQKALELHVRTDRTPLEILRRLGGFEIAALTSSYIACSRIGLPILVDGFISSVAALTATRHCPGVEQWFLFSHTSAEPGHQIVLDALDARPLLNLGMRLGEGSGAAVALPLLRMACALHNEMITFEEAGVSQKGAE